MSFTFTDAHISDYYTQGYTVFRGILPPSLMRARLPASKMARKHNVCSR